MTMQLLELRLDALKGDVGKVKEVVGEARKRTDDIRRIKDRLEDEAADGGREALRQIRALAARISNVLRESPQIRAELSSYDRTLAEALSSEMPEYLERLRHLLDDVKRDIADLDHDMVDLPAELVGPLEASLKTRCREVSKKISVLESEVRGTATDPDAFRHLWNRYDQMLKDDARPLFVEYVDFAGGLAVRDNALDDRVCQMSDVLLKDLSHVTMNALSVPARQAALGTIMKSVFKLGFPEWTIWGIPLVGHEIGLSIAENDKGVDSLVNSASFGIHRSRQKSLFADIFATYTLGPAYACAAILLRFEPHHASAPRGDPSDIDRARLILDVLDRLGEDQVSSYCETVAKLRNLWKEAVDNLARQGAGPPGNAGHADIDGFLAAAWEILSDSPGFKAFDSEHWLAAADWLSDLNTPVPKRSFNWDNNDVIVLLTAAWRARLETPEHTARIATNASDLWRSAPDRGHNVRKPAGLNPSSDRGTGGSRR